MNLKIVLSGLGVAAVSIVAAQYVEFGTVGSVPAIMFVAIGAGVLIGLGISSQVFKSPNLSKYTKRYRS